MNKPKTPAEPDEMRMPADEFDEMMRAALGVPPGGAPNEPKASLKPNDEPKPPKEKGTRRGN